MAKSSKIRKSARGEDCSLRLGNCSGNDTVVLAHIGKNKGMGIKCADWLAIYCCNDCHMQIDGHKPSQFSKIELDSEKLRALEETLDKLFKKELLCIG
tara:strand:- start:4172 stop:4465 length:294 start_codon:yes stop_codon:yes gene_type:complete